MGAKEQMERNKIYKIAAVGVFGALVFISNYISIPIPVAVGDVSRIHLGNALCILAGLVLGPVSGGLSAGIGSALFDITMPAYIASAPFTLIFKFVLALIPGLMAKKGKNLNCIFGCVLGQIAYIILYLGKSYVQGLVEGNAPGALFPVMLTKLGTSCINAVIAVIIAMVLYQGVKLALKKSKLSFT